MKRPNFFIFGAAKCGTTAMYEYLRGHPGVFMPSEKEPHHFCDDFPGFQHYKSAASYASLFEPATDSQVVVGEASVFYLYSQVAARRVYEFNPEAKLLVMLRNPVDIVPSFHGEMFYTRIEDERDLATAWRLQGARAAGRSLPTGCRVPEFLQYGKVARLGEQVERVLDVFPREQVSFVLFDDFRRSPRGAYERVLAFLDLPSDGRRDFEPVNQRKAPRFERLQNFLYYPPRPIAQARDAVKRALGIRRTNVGMLLKRLNTVKAPRDALPSELRAEFLDYFRDDVARLGRCLECDLSHWTSAPERAE